MAAVLDRFFEEGTRVLTPPAFELVLDAELKRAIRSQSFVTLVVIEARRTWDGFTVAAGRGAFDDLVRIAGHGVRETDLLGATGNGALAVVLLDAGDGSARTVIDRLARHIHDYEFPVPLHISMGAAICPTHAIDALSLTRHALTQPAVSWRSAPET